MNHSIPEYKHPWYEYLETYVPKETNTKTQPSRVAASSNEPIHCCWGDTTLE